MTIAFVDTSVLVAITFGERDAGALDERLRSFDAVFAAPLLESEFRAALARQRLGVDAELPQFIRWVYIAGPLTTEIITVLRAGYVRGADCHHLATALTLAPDPTELTFFTLDLPQRQVAATLGFQT